MNPLILASHNPGKLRELTRLLAPLGFEISNAVEMGLDEPEEPYPTFVENALAKARHVSFRTGQMALADDSGLCVKALGGAPGVHSARFGGEPKDDGRNNRHLIEALREFEDRRAFYYCVLVLVRSLDDPAPLIAEGRWHGLIQNTPRGEGGFGYDPHFFVPALACTAAELTLERKNQLSHRALALQKLLEALRET